MATPLVSRISWARPYPAGFLCLETFISVFDDDMRTRNLLIRTYVEKPPVLFIVAGQSNAAGYVPQAYESAAYCGQLWDYRPNVNKLVPLKDPTNPRYSDYGSAWPAFARHFFEITGRKSVIVNVAKGASYVTNHSENTWYGEDDTNELRVIASTQFMAVTEALGTAETDYILGGILWIQGEAEATGLGQGTISVSEYKSGTLDVFRFFKEMTANPDLQIYMSQIGFHSQGLTNPVVQSGYEKVQKAQVELARDNENVYLAFSGAKYFREAKEMTDGVHYSQNGYNIVGKAFARFIANHQFSA